MTKASTMLAQFEQTPPAPVSDLGDVVTELATVPVVGTVLARLAPGWTGSFAELVVTACQVSDADDTAALVTEIALDRISGQRREDRLFGGAVARRRDWPAQRALGDAQSALDRWREERAACPGCGHVDRRWAAVTCRGIGPSFFIERWCAECAGPTGTPRVERQTAPIDFDALKQRHGQVTAFRSPTARPSR